MTYCKTFHTTHDKSRAENKHNSACMSWKINVSRETMIVNKPYNTTTMNKQLLLDNLRSIPDFPKKGINFRDVTTLYKNGECMKEMTDALYELYKDKGITKIVGIESRGFVMASALAARLGCGVVLARKPGKLPATVIKESFSKEYGVDTVEMHIDAINSNDVVLIHDDLLATGGTAKATYKLVKHFNPKQIYINFIIEITDEGLHGRDEFKDVELTTLLTI